MSSILPPPPFFPVRDGLMAFFRSTFLSHPKYIAHVWWYQLPAVARLFEQKDLENVVEMAGF